jgi:hypothetical protein
MGLLLLPEGRPANVHDDACSPQLRPRDPQQAEFLELDAAAITAANRSQTIRTDTPRPDDAGYS